MAKTSFEFVFAENVHYQWTAHCQRALISALVLHYLNATGDNILDTDASFASIGCHGYKVVRKGGLIDIVKHWYRCNAP